MDTLSGTNEKVLNNFFDPRNIMSLGKNMSLYDRLKEFHTGSHLEVGDGTKPLIDLNSTWGPATYYDPEKFNDFYVNLMCDKIKENSLTTDKYNHWQVNSATNVIYLDGDWHFKDTVNKVEYEQVSAALASEYMSVWVNAIEDAGVEVNFQLTFLPETYPNSKGGFHCFIYTKTPVTVQQRQDFYAAIKRGFVGALEETYGDYIALEKETDTLERMYETLFDTGPLYSLQALLPFAEKVKATRHYKLVDHEGFDPNDPPELFIIPSIPRSSKYNDIGEDDDVEVNVDAILPDSVEHINVDPIFEKIFKANEQERKKSRGVIGRVGRLTLDFVWRLIYLNNEHFLWKQMADNKFKTRFLNTLINFIYANYFIEHRGKFLKESEKEEFIVEVVRAVLPLMRRTLTKLDEDTNRASWNSLKGHVEWFLTRALSGNNKTDAIFDTDLAMFWKGYCEMSFKERKKMTSDDLHKLNSIQQRYQNIISAWTKFVTDIVMHGITDEIVPFKEIDRDNFDPARFNPREGVTFEDVLPRQPNVDKTVTTVEESFYVETMRIWTLMFMFVEYYNSNSMTETIRSIISTFTRYYIWSQKEMNGTTSIYIYNIHQTQMLTAFPYNQWIVDADGESVKAWIKTIYLQFIKKELQTINKCRRLMPFLSNLSNAGIPISDAIGINVKPLPNFDSDMDRVYKNILAAFTQERYAPPRELSICNDPYFPMRNGLLEFRDDGSVIFHRDNHDKFMHAHTNVEWLEDYYDLLKAVPKYVKYGEPDINGNTKNVPASAHDKTIEEVQRAHQAISNMLKQIYPYDEEREYAMKIYASVLHGKGQRDQFVIQYGTGGDGKTTMNNLVNSMLGTEGCTGSIQVFENGKNVYIQNPHGLATSMKTETVLVSKANGHDEGGIIQLKDKRFCSVQEPDPALSGGKLNCARIKDMTGGTQVTGRKIYKGAEAFVPNCLITLQTNFIPGYSEDSDATRRRLVVMPFRSKFCSEINQDRMKQLEFWFKADPMLNHMLTTNPRYWQAFFYILLPYAREMISKPSLSNIPRPVTIKEATNDSFSRSNGIVGWINKNIVKVEGHLIQVTELVNIIIQEHVNTVKMNGGLLQSKGKCSQMNEVYQQLGSTYTGSIYKLHDNYYTADHSDLVAEVAGGITQIMLESALEPGYTNEHVRALYFYKYAVENMERSTIMDKSDLYILGYDLKDRVNGIVGINAGGAVSEGGLSENQRESNLSMD